MARIGITGATGFVGGALVPRLLRQGHDLLLLDDRSGPVRVEPEGATALDLDFASDAALRVLSNADVILHLGAVSGVMVCARDPEGSARRNVEGTRRLYAMCRERKIPAAFASSLSVVGAPDRFPIGEDTPARPTHEYARQKAAGEALTRELSDLGDVPTAVLRQSNVYGGYEASGRWITKSNVLELFARQAARGVLEVNAPGTQRRDFVHLDDVLSHWEATVDFLRRPSTPAAASVFNVASGETRSVRELAELVARAYAKAHPDRAPLRIEVVPNPRGGIELVEPDFETARAMTERLLGVKILHHLPDEIPRILDLAGLGARAPGAA